MVLRRPSLAIYFGITILVFSSVFMVNLTLYPSLVTFKENSSHLLAEREVLHAIIENLEFVRGQLHNHTTQSSWAKKSTIALNKVFILLNSITGPIENRFQTGEKLTEKPETPDICPDKFVHANLSEPNFLNGSWQKVECGEEGKVQDILTILLFPSQTEDCTERTDLLLQQIQLVHPDIRIVVAANSYNCKIDDKSASVLEMSVDESAGETWTKLINSVRTKYVLLGRGLDEFSWLTQVKRQLAVLSDVKSPQLNIVGGAFRNDTGHWEVGCYQSKLKFYQLIYTDGYYKSKNECMFCNYLKGPFIAKTSLFKRISFDRTMPAGIVFEDFFLRINDSNAVMACPDAMYFATDPNANQKIDNRSTWLPLVKKLELNRVVLPDSIRHKYSCEESGSSCKALYNHAGNRYMPVCCMDEAMKGYKAFHEFSVKHNLPYYAIGGTTLGAIKFRDIIPWDFDGDLMYYSNNFSFFDDNKSAFGDGKTLYFGNFHMKWYDYFRINTPDFFIEMFGGNDTAIEHTDKTELFHAVPTKIRIRGEWFYGPPSPGLYARNQYGTELYKHANSWFNQGHLWFDPYKVQSSFPKCSKPGYHYCYDDNPVDGSFGFTVT